MLSLKIKANYAIQTQNKLQLKTKIWAIKKKSINEYIQVDNLTPPVSSSPAINQKK